jgi:isopentenyl-diphosphate delta-isomerase
MIQKVILVNEKDEVLGSMEKLEAHLKGALHRAFSIFIFNDQKELLIHQRAFDKYHSPGLWTNTCCSHPYPNETSLDAANRRLEEEMGMQCELIEQFSFIYKERINETIEEYELDHVFLGKSNSNPKINTEEVAAYKWISLPDLKEQMLANPNDFTIWFKIIITSYIDKFQFQ